jgi:NAD(P)-dependent dehydrogenase (short-subunit alcohol dehydrogenase family)
MAKQGGGVIVNIAASVATVGNADRTAYCASKGAVGRLCK